MFFAVILGLFYAISFPVDAEWGQFTDADSLRFKKATRVAQSYSRIELFEAMEELRKHYGGKFTPEDVYKMTGVWRGGGSSSSGVKHREGAAGTWKPRKPWREVEAVPVVAADCVSSDVVDEAVQSGWVVDAISVEESEAEHWQMREAPDDDDETDEQDDGHNVNHQIEGDQSDKEKCLIPRPIQSEDCCSLILTGSIGATMCSC